MGALVVGLAGCGATEVREEPVVEEPVAEDVRSFSDIGDLSELTAEDLATIGEVGTFLAGSGLIDIEIRWPEGAENHEMCNRELFLWNAYVSIYPDSPIGPHQAVWAVRLDQSDPDLWYRGDYVVIDKKSDVCFAGEPFTIHNPVSVRPSGPPTVCWRPGDPQKFWDYSVALFNPGCETEENESGRVAFLDPVVVIDPGTMFFRLPPIAIPEVPETQAVP